MLLPLVRAKSCAAGCIAVRSQSKQKQRTPRDLVIVAEGEHVRVVKVGRIGVDANFPVADRRCVSLGSTHPRGGMSC